MAEIANRAGLTERTFFRHFADKREALFGSSGALEELVVTAVVGAPGDAAADRGVAAGIYAAAGLPASAASARSGGRRSSRRTPSSRSES